MTPTTLAQVQDLLLHGTNSIVISDAFNILRTFTADAQNLTLSTNGSGNGASSVDGELNVENGNIFSWPSSLPNLRNLTNNGAIRFQNQAQFNGSSNIVTITPGTNAVAATGKLSETNLTKNVVAGNKVLIGTNQYVFVTKLTNTIPNQIKIGTKFDGSLSNLIAAINRAAGAGTTYSTNTATNTQVVAGLLVNHAFAITARTAGAAGNLIQTASSLTTTNLIWSGAYLAGGLDYVAATTNITSTAAVPYSNFVNHGLVSDQGTAIWSANFENSGMISNILNPFSLSSLTTTITGGAIVADGYISITAASLLASNCMLSAGQSLTLQATNLLTDGVANGNSGLTNANFWSVQSPNGTGGNGLMLPIKPAQGDLLGTTISNYAAPNKAISYLWAGQDRGVSASGYTNNVAVGRLVLDALSATSQFKFSGTGTSNALYVDALVLLDQATNGINTSYDFSANLSISTNLVIYFAQATVGGVSIAEKINNASLAGANGGRLLWVPQYAGYFSSTNLVYPDGSTNTVNAALAASKQVDSDGDGTANAGDASPFFTSAEVDFAMILTNAPAPTVVLTWDSIPGATNFVQSSTNFLTGWFTAATVTNSLLVPPAGGWPITNTVTMAVTNNPSVPHFYRVRIDPNTLLLYGN